jgi:hypothetical protein
MTRKQHVVQRIAVAFLLALIAGWTGLMAAEQPQAATWQQDIRGLAAYMKADEAFWKNQRAVEEPVEWTAKIFDIEHQMVEMKPGNIVLWLEVPYTKEQTEAGLAPLPVQVVVAPESSLAKTVTDKTFKNGAVVHVKGIFKGFVYSGRDYSGKNTTQFGQANDVKSAFAMIMKQSDTGSQMLDKAEAYAKARHLPLKASASRRIILPLLEVAPESIDVVK